MEVLFNSLLVKPGFLRGREREREEGSWENYFMDWQTSIPESYGKYSNFLG